MGIVDIVARMMGGREVETPADVAVPADVVVRESGLVTAVGGALSGMGGPAAAVTLGRTILIRPGVTPSSRLIRHELAHVRQWRERPYTFPIRYTWAHIRHGYSGNPYERAARAAETGERASGDPSRESAGGHTG